VEPRATKPLKGNGGPIHIVTPFLTPVGSNNQTSVADHAQEPSPDNRDNSANRSLELKNVMGEDRLNLATPRSSGKPPPRGPMPGDQETLNPAPDKDSSREQPSTEGEGNDPDIEDE